jgi:hypothetical protein
MKHGNIMWTGFGAVTVLGLALSTEWAMQESAAKEIRVKALAGMLLTARGD